MSNEKHGHLAGDKGAGGSNGGSGGGSGGDGRKGPDRRPRSKSRRNILLLIVLVPLVLHGLNALNNWYLQQEAEGLFAEAIVALPPAQDAIFIMPDAGRCYVPYERCLEALLDPKFRPKSIYPVQHMRCQNPDSPFCPQQIDGELEEVKHRQPAGLLRTNVVLTERRINGELSSLIVGYDYAGPLWLPVPGLGALVGFFTPMVSRSNHRCLKTYIPAFKEGERLRDCGERLQ